MYYSDVSQSPRVLFLDGLWGSGKSLLGQLVATLNGLGPFRISSHPESITHMLAQEKLSEDLFKCLFLQTIVEQSYNASIGREINLRIWDDSSFLKTMSLRKVAGRLASRPSVSDLPNNVLKQEPYFQMTHLLTQSGEALMRVLPGLVTIINIQRNPAFLFNHWERYLRRWDMKRELTLAIQFRGVKVPFFAEKWAGEWISSSIAERAALSVARCSAYERTALATIGSPRESVHTVYFSELLKEPVRIMEGLSRTLERDFSAVTEGKLRRLAQRRGRGNNKPRPELVPGARDGALAEVKEMTNSRVFAEFRQCVWDFEALESSRSEVSE